MCLCGGLPCRACRLHRRAYAPTDECEAAQREQWKKRRSCSIEVSSRAWFLLACRARRKAICPCSFKYRGLMLDCGRNYQSVASIKDVISTLADYKMNVFHWHLTDNYGWRLESKKHPELQKKEAFSRNVGKFYTQAEFKDVLAFAKKRGVTVIPELDMPGHTLAFRKATGIDDLSCEEAKVILGELIDELCSLAPAADMPIVHLGTDEARERGEKVPQTHLDYWAKKVTDNGRTLMGWSPGLRLPGQSIKQLWMLLRFKPPTVVVCKMPVKDVHLVVREGRDDVFD